MRRQIDDSGLERVDVEDPDADGHVVFVGPRSPQAERQIKAG